MNIKTTLKSSVAAAALLAIAAPAQAGSIANGKDTASVTLSGHFNKAVLWQESGSASAVSFVDNTASSSRARIIAKGKMNEAVSVSGVFEWGMSTNLDGNVTPVDTATTLTSANDHGDGVGSGFFTVRHSYVKFDHKQLGSVSLGHTSQATDGAAENNMTGATDVVYGGSLIGSGGIHLQANNAADNVFTTKIVGDFFSNGDGGRTDVIKYTTPSFGGFSVSASADSDSQADVAASFGGKFGGFAVDATIGYGNDSGGSDTVENVTMGSVAVGHDSGINARMSYQTTDNKGTTNKENDQLSIGLGYKAKLTSMGSTNFAVDYIVANDVESKGSEGKAYIFGVEQTTDAGVNFYLGGSFIETDITGTSYEDVTTVIAGTKVFF